ncbi:MAG: four helix bundle protein [Planctomycetaceae bacterium]|nr:four helix bundle protein [Planctomycetaceae bacterium]
MSPSEDTPSGAPAENKPAFEKKSFFDKKLSDRPERFEDFSIWQEARRFTNRLYDVTEKPDLVGDLGVRDALRRSSVDVMTRLAEACESGGDRDFSRGLTHAKASAAAVRSLVFIGTDRGYFTEPEQIELAGRAASLIRMIGSQLFRLKRAEGTDFKRSGPGGPGGFAGKKPGFGPKKPYGSKPPGGFSGKKPFRPKRDD